MALEHKLERGIEKKNKRKKNSLSYSSHSSQKSKNEETYFVGMTAMIKIDGIFKNPLMVRKFVRGKTWSSVIDLVK